MGRRRNKWGAVKQQGNGGGGDGGEPGVTTGWGHGGRGEARGGEVGVVLDLLCFQGAGVADRGASWGGTGSWGSWADPLLDV